MDRPSRKTKSVNYCESNKEFEEDDEDFAKAPPRKKSKEALNNKTFITCQEPNSQSLPSQKSRKPLDMRIHERDLEAAISLSLLNPSSKTSDQSPTYKDDMMSAVDENTEPSVLHLSNCSVDGLCLGLDQITSDSRLPSKERKDASCVQRNELKTQDDDYQPCIASDSESDNDYSEHESEDEEFTVKKASKTKREQGSKNGKAKQTPSGKKQNKPQKSKSTVQIIFSNVCASVVSTPTRTPLTTKNISEPTRSVSLKVSKPAVCLSPGVSRVPKWNPPGQIGKSSSSSNSATVRSPGQGLRLGLSRLVRVKPLHSSVVPSH